MPRVIIRREFLHARHTASTAAAYFLNNAIVGRAFSNGRERVMAACIIPFDWANARVYPSEIRHCPPSLPCSIFGGNNPKKHQRTGSDHGRVSLLLLCAPSLFFFSFFFSPLFDGNASRGRRAGPSLPLPPPSPFPHWHHGLENEENRATLGIIKRACARTLFPITLSDVTFYLNSFYDLSHLSRTTST